MQMYYEVSGNGDPLIVLHGAYMNIPTMGAIIPKLAATHKVYALEFQGHGRTTDIDRPITYQNLADDVAAFMDAVGLDEGGRVRLLDGRRGRTAARHSPSGEGQQARRGVGRVRSRGLAAGVHGDDPADDGRDDRRRCPSRRTTRKLAANPNGFPELARKLIALEKEPMAWEADVKALKTPVLIIAGDADVATLEHSVALFRLLGGGGMGDMGKPLPASRLAVLPATSHTAVITQPDLLHAFIEPFLKGMTPKRMFEASGTRD